MCYHKSLVNSIDYLADYYSASYSDVMAEIYTPRYHENGFDFLASPIITAERKNELLPYNWGLIPWWTKSLQDGLRLRVQTLNCISEEMYDKPSFRDAATENKRCLIPCSGFFEWRWMDEKGKSKVPYYLTLPDQPLFSIAGLYSKWKDRSTDQELFTYTVLTTKANRLMEKIHNSKKRMPVIIPRQYEGDWLNPNLTKDDVMALCQPFDPGMMNGYTISKLITSKTEETDVPKVMERQEYPEVLAADSGVVTQKVEPPKKKKSPKSSGSNEGQGSLF
jgi:putative SOS response-associated peptidase YedK